MCLKSCQHSAIHYDYWLGCICDQEHGYMFLMFYIWKNMFMGIHINLPQGRLQISWQFYSTGPQSYLKKEHSSQAEPLFDEWANSQRKLPPKSFWLWPIQYTGAHVLIYFNEQG